MLYLVLQRHSDDEYFLYETDTMRQVNFNNNTLFFNTTEKVTAKSVQMLAELLKMEKDRWRRGYDAVSMNSRRLLLIDQLNSAIAAERTPQRRTSIGTLPMPLKIVKTEPIEIDEENEVPTPPVPPVPSQPQPKQITIPTITQKPEVREVPPKPTPPPVKPTTTIETTPTEQAPAEPEVPSTSASSSVHPALRAKRPAAKRENGPISSDEVAKIFEKAKLDLKKPDHTLTIQDECCRLGWIFYKSLMRRLGLKDGNRRLDLASAAFMKLKIGEMLKLSSERTDHVWSFIRKKVSSEKNKRRSSTQKSPKTPKAVKSMTKIEPAKSPLKEIKPKALPLSTSSTGYPDKAAVLSIFSECKEDFKPENYSKRVVYGLIVDFSRRLAKEINADPRANDFFTKVNFIKDQVNLMLPLGKNEEFLRWKSARNTVVTYITRDFHNPQQNTDANPSMKTDISLNETNESLMEQSSIQDENELNGSLDSHPLFTNSMKEEPSLASASMENEFEFPSSEEVAGVFRTTESTYDPRLYPKFVKHGFLVEFVRRLARKFDSNPTKSSVKMRWLQQQVNAFIPLSDDKENHRRWFNARKSIISYINRDRLAEKLTIRKSMPAKLASPKSTDGSSTPSTQNRSLIEPPTVFDQSTNQTSDISAEGQNCPQQSSSSPPPTGFGIDSLLN